MVDGTKGSERRSAGTSDWSETGAITRSNRLDDWIAIERDGRVTIRSGKVELGTGVRTALAQIAAEELDVALGQIRMVMGDTGSTPDEGYTAGSKTVQNGGYSLRHAAAEARMHLLELASERLGVPADALEVEEGVVRVARDPTRSLSYAELSGGRQFNRTMSGHATPKSPGSYRLVGTGARRVDLPGKFFGTAGFVHDMKLPGMIHARMVHPPAPGAIIQSVGKESAASARIVRIGRSFLAVVAEREEDAVRAAGELKVDWSEPRSLPDFGDIFRVLKREEAERVTVTVRGASEPAGSGRRIHAVYRQPYQSHASMGPSCSVADYGEDGVTIFCSSQGVYPLRGAVSELLGLNPDRVRIIFVEGAGCYGHNGADDVAAEAALISREVGRPVRLLWSRRDEFVWEPYGTAMETRLSATIGDNGRISQWQHETWTPTHTYRPRAGADLIASELVTDEPIPPRSMQVGGDRNAPTNYSFANEQVVMNWIRRSPLRVSSLRSLGAMANAFANESFMDEAAVASGIDPVRFRVDHLDDPRAREVVERAAERAGWGRALPEGEGLGIAFSRYENTEAFAATVAHVRVDRESGTIRVKRLTVAHDCGLIINPDGLRNQIEGNLIQGTSRALKEQVRWGPDGVTTVDWKSYPILTFAEIPEIDILLINRPEEKALGAGEPATITAAPAIANAAFAAAGVRLRNVPFTPESVKALL